MLLVIAVVAGLTAGLVRAYVKKRQLVIPDIIAGWLVPTAFIPQGLCFFIPFTRSRIPNNVVAVILIITQLMLLVFALLNRKQPGFWALGLGVALNTLVISANRGWMPISPATLFRLNPEITETTWTIGQRLGVSKDIILHDNRMVFPALSDRIVLPPFLHSHLAYSLGDIFIAWGAFGLLWSVGKKSLGSKYEVNA